MIVPRLANTKDRILDAAERLFAERGFAETSLRDITAEAGANLAAVNYHFQSKDALIQAVFARRIGPVNEKRLAALDALEARAEGGPVPLEDVLRAFMGPMLGLLALPEGANPARLMGRLFVEPGDLFERIFKEQLASTAGRFMAAIQGAVPDLPETELYWKFLFAAGAVGHTIAGLRKITVISGGRCDIEDVDGLLERLVAFISGGFRASVDVSAKGEPACNGSR